MFRFGIQKRKHASTILELIILRVLRDQKKLHGYEIQRQVMRLLNRTWRPSFSLLYPLLRSMQKRGLIRRTAVFRGRRRIYEYEITDKGLEHYTKLMEMLRKRTYEIISSTNDDYSALPLIFFTTDIGSKLLFEIFEKKEILEILEALNKLLKRIEEKRLALLKELQ